MSVKVATVMNENKETKTVKKYNSPMAYIPIVAGILLNYLGSKIAAASGLPIYIDNIGTVAAAVLGGYLPGIITGVVNNIINYALDSVSIYYASISALIAVAAAYVYRGVRKGSFMRAVQMILLAAFIGGILGGIITWFLSGPTTDGINGDIYRWFMCHLGLGSFYSHEFSAFLLDLADKAVTVAAALLIIKLVPEKYRSKMWLSGWKQKPLEDESVSRGIKIRDINVDNRSLNNRITLMLVFATLSMAVIVTGVSSSLFRQYSREEHLNTASGIAKLAASVIDPEMVDTYIKEGDSAEGYADVESRLLDIRESSPDIEYVYVYQIREDGCHVVFDLDTEDVEADEPGTVIPFDESFDELIPDLLAGKHIEPIETDDTFGWLLTAYEPVYDSSGKCVCYAAADVMFRDIEKYEKDFAIRVVLLFLGFFILILVTGLWLSRYNIILPINSMASCAGEFAFSDDSGDESMAEENLRRINELDIRTGDEVQRLYESFVKMTADSVEHMKDIRKQGQSILRLQNGLIMSLADMVEGRDSDTGNHVRKTAAYCRIILEALKRKGYYTDQLTDKFMYDVERSAPLHDIGKIAVSDVILNKPGKLTEDEFEIMKTHTTAGRELLDRVIESVEGESYLHEARNLAGSHHEKWNGMGYPDGLAGEDIPLSARIMAIADVFDALTSKRVYKDPMSYEKAVNIIKNDAGTHFDPKCVEAFLDSLDEVKGVLDYYNALEEGGITVRGNELDNPEDRNETIQAKQDTRDNKDE